MSVYITSICKRNLNFPCNAKVALFWDAMCLDTQNMLTVYWIKEIFPSEFLVFISIHASFRFEHFLSAIHKEYSSGPMFLEERKNIKIA